MTKKIVFFLLLATAMNAAAQGDGRPGWLKNKPKASNSTYTYVIEQGSGSTVNEAVNNALLKVIRTTMMRIGATVTWSEVNTALQNGEDWGNVVIEYNIPVNKVCEYAEEKGNGYVVAILCQVATNGNVYPEFDDFLACHDTRTYSNGAAMLKSMVIPGLGQMGKRRYGAGWLTLVGEAVLGGGAIASYLVGNMELSHMEGSYSPGDYLAFANSYNTCEKIHYSCLTAAAILYIYNVVRAATITPRYKNDYFALEPTMMQTDQTLAAGFSFSINF